MSRVCPHCKKTVHSRARRCKFCKHKLKPKIIICKECGREFRRANKYCPHCRTLNPTFVDKVKIYMLSPKRRYRRRRYHRRLRRYNRNLTLIELLLDIGIDIAAYCIAHPGPKRKRGYKRRYNPKTKKKGKGRYYAKKKRKKRMKYG